jgi:hypothetical protein
MLRLLLSMHHIALCNLCIATNYVWLIYSMLDCALTKPELEIQEEQSSGEYGGPQATIFVDTNLALDQGKPRYI